ncbi:hypothetical protein [Vibrio metschnikovii]
MTTSKKYQQQQRYQENEVQTLLSVWATSFARHLARRAFDEITVSVITTQ